MNKYFYKLFLLFISILLFAVMYSFLDNSHFEGLNPIQDKLKEQEIEEKTEEMKRQFYSISEGGYADILFSKFSKDRVETELNKFMEHKFFKRSGGGIGVTRMIRAMKLSNLI